VSLRPPWRRARSTEAAPPELPAARIEFPTAGATVPRTPLIVAGWALGADGPIDAGVVLVDGAHPTAARLATTPRDDVASRFPGVEGAAGAGWDAIVDVRGVEGPEATLSLLGRTGGGWAELARSPIRLAEAGAATAGRRAVFTIARNEATFLPIWLRYYRRHFDPADIYVLDNDSADGSTDGLEGSCRVVPVHRVQSAERDSASLLVWLKGTVEDFQAFLLRSYDTVLFAEVDELVVPDPRSYPDLGAYVDRLDGAAACCTGYNVVHYPDEAALRFDQPLLAQRRYWHPSPHWYSKRLLARIPLSWNIGFHDEYNVPGAEPDPDLYLIHLHRVDYDYCLARHRAAADREWADNDLRLNLSWHQRIAEPEEFRRWFFGGEDLEGTEREPIPERIRELV
jgi:hypothetical protein